MPDNPNTLIACCSLQIERKQISIEFRENDRGRFLRIIEEAHGHRNAVIVPSTGIEEFRRMLDQVLSTAIPVPVN